MKFARENDIKVIDIGEQFNAKIKNKLSSLGTKSVDTIDASEAKEQQTTVGLEEIIGGKHKEDEEKGDKKEEDVDSLPSDIGDDNDSEDEKMGEELIVGINKFKNDTISDKQRLNFAERKQEIDRKLKKNKLKMHKLVTRNS